MGQRITKIRPVGGFCAEAGGAVMLIGTALAGIPVSTTHTITGSIMGVGLANSLLSKGSMFGEGVNWAKAGEVGAIEAGAVADGKREGVPEGEHDGGGSCGREVEGTCLNGDAYVQE